MKFPRMTRFQSFALCAAIAFVAMFTKCATAPTQSGDKQKQTECVVVISCMDDYCLEPARQYVREIYGAKRIDSPTLAGPNLVLAENKNRPVVEYLMEEVEIAVKEHNGTIIFICGHEGCLGNRNTKEKQMEHSRQAKKLIEERKTGAEVRMLWITKQKKAEEFK